MVMYKQVTPARRRSYSCSMPGVWRAVSGNEGALVIYHSPQACGHISRQMDLSLYYQAVSLRRDEQEKSQIPLLISGIREEETIFGSGELLKDCIFYAAEHYRPAYILIASSCVAGVIGDDAGAIAREAEECLGVPVLAVPCHGYLDGEYYTGFYQAGKLMAERLMTIVPPSRHTALLLGDRGSDRLDAQEVKELLGYFGFTSFLSFPSGASFADIRAVPSSAISVAAGSSQPFYPWLQRLGGDLQALYGVPFFDCQDPAGWQNTCRWLAQLGEFTGKPQNVQPAIKKQEERLRQHIGFCRPVLKEQRIVVCLGRRLEYFQPEWLFEILDLYGVAVAGVVVLEVAFLPEQRTELYQSLACLTASPVVNETDGAELIRQSDLAITSHALSDPRQRQFFLPMLPPVGVGGIIELMTKLTRLAKRYGGRGGIVYG